MGRAQSEKYEDNRAVKGEDKLDFSGILSPYDILAEAQPVLARDVKKAFVYLRDLFQDQRFRERIGDYEREKTFESKLQLDRWLIPSELWQNHLDDLHLEFNFGLGEEQVSHLMPVATPTRDDLTNLTATSLNLMGR